APRCPPVQSTGTLRRGPRWFTFPRVPRTRRRVGTGDLCVGGKRHWRPRGSNPACVQWWRSAQAGASVTGHEKRGGAEAPPSVGRRTERGESIAPHMLQVVKLCECGCGLPAPIAHQSDTKRGYVKGEPRRFRHGHYARGRKHTPETIEKMRNAQRAEQHP